MDINLRDEIPLEEFDYVILKSALRNYRNPRVKINDLIKKRVIIRVKKGLYIFGPMSSRKLYIKEVLANLIYGPSYISLEYALSFYGLIPERTETVTCVTNKRIKNFQTPIGNFSYRYINPGLYSTGITQLEIDDQHRILIATREKAIADFLYFSPLIKTKEQLRTFLFDNMRFDPDLLEKLNQRRLKQLGKLYSGNTDLFWRFLHE